MERLFLMALRAHLEGLVRTVQHLYDHGCINPYLYARFGVVLASLRLLIDNAELQLEMDDEVDQGNTPPSLLTAQVCHSGHVFL